MISYDETFLRNNMYALESMAADLRPEAFLVAIESSHDNTITKYAKHTFISSKTQKELDERFEELVKKAKKASRRPKNKKCECGWHKKKECQLKK